MSDNLLSMSDLSDINVDVNSVALCRKFRKFATANNIELVKEGNSRENKYAFELFSYINSELDTYNDINNTSVTIDEFVKNYIANLQPSMISRKNLNYNDNTYLAVIDKLYKNPLYIKIRDDKEHLIISFHEDLNKGYKKSIIIKGSRDDFSYHEFIPVIADDYKEEYPDENKNAYLITVSLPIGMEILSFYIHDARMTTEGYFIISSLDLQKEIIKKCQQIFNEINSFVESTDNPNILATLETVDVYKAFNNINITNRDLTFTSFGKTSQSVLSYLIDVETACESNNFVGVSRKTIQEVKRSCNLLLGAYLINCQKLPESKIKNLIEFLDTRYAYSLDNNDKTGNIVKMVKSTLLNLSDSSNTPVLKVIDTKESLDEMIDFDTEDNTVLDEIENDIFKR